MGIYPALAASGALSEGDAIEMAFRVGACMARMAPAGTYALGCMVGLTIEPLLAIAENNGVYVANLNTSRHFLLSGPRRNIEEAEAEALQAGAFSVRTFPSDAPLHTPLLAGLEGGLREIFAGYRYREPEVPLLDHIDQEYLTAGDLAEFLVRELTLPVYWEKSYRALRRAGVSSFYEAGAGDALKKYNRWIDSE
jgi:malonyl CoA-acyl carrier protein transacylase